MGLQSGEGRELNDWVRHVMKKEQIYIPKVT